VKEKKGRRKGEEDGRGRKMVERNETKGKG